MNLRTYKHSKIRSQALENHSFKKNYMFGVCFFAFRVFEHSWYTWVMFSSFSVPPGELDAAFFLMKVEIFM